MTETLSITRQDSGPPGLTFADLYRDGLKLLQELAGERWTDFNVHDPGVTILEQLCYALTESIHKAGFPVADYLCGPDGVVDANRQALFEPQTILPCRPVTIDDYRKAIFDEVPSIDDIHLDPGPPGARTGLYTILIHMSEDPVGGAGAHDPRQVEETVRSVYCRQRNLCEDLAAVTIVKTAVYRLNGRIEIDGAHDPAALLAQIYFRCGRLIAPGLPVQTYTRALGQGQSLDAIFTGPLTRHAGELQTPGRAVTLSDLYAAIRAVHGVGAIHNLSLADAAGQTVESLPSHHHDDTASPVLAVPRSPAEIGLTLIEKGREFPVSFEAMRSKLKQLVFEFRAPRHLAQDFSVLLGKPEARPRPLADYTSIQNHFPRVYGIGREGVPATDSPERQAQARQLKAYLLFFDQLMADFNAQLANIARLFSTDPGLDRTYFHQALSERSVPGLNDLQVVCGAELERRLDAIFERYDKAADRRNRVLDHLLAMYGEKFSQKYMRHLQHDLPSDQGEQTIISNKIRLLQGLPVIGANRGAGSNYRDWDCKDPQWTGFELKVRILLGLSEARHRSLTKPLTDQGSKMTPDAEGFHVVEHILLRPLTAAAAEHTQVPDKFYPFRLSVVFPAWTVRFRDKAFQRHAEQTLRLNCPAHLVIQVYWLDLDGMRDFQAIYREWRKAKSTEPDGSKALDALSGRLAQWLWNHEAKEVS